MKIFLSYSHQDKDIADDVNLALSSHYSVFFDKDDLPKAEDFNTRIRKAIEETDLFIFLISPNSVKKQSYTLTEVELVRAKWNHPKNHVLPVLIEETKIEDIPSYLKAVNWVKTDGDIPATVVNEVIKIESVTDFDVNKSMNQKNSHIYKEKKPLIKYLALGLASVAILLSTWQLFQSSKYKTNTDNASLLEVSKEVKELKKVAKNLGWSLNHTAAVAACTATSPINKSMSSHIMIPREYQKSCKVSCKYETNRVYTECLASIAIGGIIHERANKGGQVLATYYKYDCNQFENGNDETKVETIAYNAYCCCHVPVPNK